MKRPPLFIRTAAFALFSVVLSGCGDWVPAQPTEDGGSGASSSGFRYDAEKGTCDGWKVRYCEAFVQCGHGTEEECIFEAEYVTCKTNAPFVGCEKQFQEVIDENDCSLFPNDCYPRDIADRSAATELCEDVQEAACEYDFFCGFSFSLETCLSETSHIYECRQRLSAVPGGEACVTALNQAACGDSLPASCQDHTRF